MHRRLSVLSIVSIPVAMLGAPGYASAEQADEPAPPVPSPAPAPEPAALEKRMADLEARMKVAEDRAKTATDELDSIRKEREGVEAAKAEERRAAEQAAAAKKAPFTGDYTWMNGQSRQKTFPLSVDGGAVTPSVYFDAYYAYSLNDPIDNTLTGSASIGRHNELQINLASVGVDWNYENVIGRVLLQWGAQTEVVQNLDGTVGRGRTLSTDALRYIREATVGYHFDALWGINIEAGIFMSYIGLESYLLGENWNYHRSLVCDFTPFYFTGIRTQFFVLDNLKIEPWLMNGYQTYGKWNEAPSGGVAMRWNPKEWLAFIANFYVGTDTRNDDKRVRFHHDHSFLIRAYNEPDSLGLSKVAFSVNNHAGFESGGDGAPLEEANFLGTAIATRWNFLKDHLALAGRFDFVRHPSGYTAQFPPPGFDAGDDFFAWGLTGTVDVMPTDFFSIRPEVTYRRSNKGFFAGSGGTTSEDGFQDTADPSFVADTERDQVLLNVGLTFRL